MAKVDHEGAHTDASAILDGDHDDDGLGWAFVVNLARAYLWERARNDGLIEDARVASESANNLRTRVAELEAAREALRDHYPRAAEWLDGLREQGCGDDGTLAAEGPGGVES